MKVETVAKDKEPGAENIRHECTVRNRDERRIVP